MIMIIKTLLTICISGFIGGFIALKICKNIYEER